MFVADDWAGAAHRNMAAALTGPLKEGAAETPIAVGADGRVDVSWSSYEPMLVAAPIVSVGDYGLRLEASLQGGGELPVLTFAPWTEAASFLCLYRPPGDKVGRSAPPFSLALRLYDLLPDKPLEVPADQISARVEVALLEGLTGRVMFALGAEKPRLRRHARAVAAMRTLRGARNDALDRSGADLEVPRLADHLTVSDGIVTPDPRHEPDSEYRARLAIYRPWLQPSGDGLRRLLELPDLRPTGSASRSAPSFALDDRGEQFAVAIKVVAGGDPELRGRLLEHVRLVHLLLPANNPYSNLVHARRFLPAARKQADTALRAELRRLFDFSGVSGATPALARPLAAALVRAGRCREALDQGAMWQCSRAQDVDAGSRYELGLAADIEPMSSATLTRLASLHASRSPNADPEVEALLMGMQPRPPDEDPDGRWLLEPCGLRTAHRLRDASLLVSHLPFDGLVIEGPLTTPVGTPATFDTFYHARSDPGPNAVLADGLATALAQWTGAGNAPWTHLSDTAARARWDGAPLQDPAAAALRTFRETGLPVVVEPAPIVTQLKQVRPELLATLVLPATLSQAIIAGSAEGIVGLRTLIVLLRDQWLTALLPIVLGPAEVGLVASVTRLPEAGSNLSRRRASGFRWYAEHMAGSAGDLSARVGPQAMFTPTASGVCVLMVLGFVRRGFTAPYEVRVTMPPESLLDFSQYELLMNLLDHAHPLGIGVNTAEIRRAHVDTDGDGIADSLSASLSRSYRAFRPRRILVTGDVFSPETPGLQVGVCSTIGVDTILAPP